MEDRYAVAIVRPVGAKDVVVEDGFSTADEALAAAVRFYTNTNHECYAVRLVPVRDDRKSSLVILREQTAAIADTTTSTRTRTEQIYHEVSALRTALVETLHEYQDELAKIRHEYVRVEAS
jgi:hypothetical protein